MYITIMQRNKRDGSFQCYYLETSETRPRRTLLSTNFSWIRNKLGATNFSSFEDVIKWVTVLEKWVKDIAEIGIVDMYHRNDLKGGEDNG